MNIAYDTETFKNFFCFCAAYDTGDFAVVKSVNGMVDKGEVGKLVGRLYKKADLVGSYNGLGYDLRIISFILGYNGGLVPCSAIKDFSDALIGDGDAPFVDIFSEDWMGIRAKHFDVLNGYKLSKSLKHWELYNGWDVHETDVAFDADVVSQEDEKLIVTYCLHDCKATLKLMNESDCQKELVVRKALVDEIRSVKGQTIPFDYPKAKLAEEWIYAEDSDIPAGNDLGAEALVPWELFDSYIPKELESLLREICVLGGFKAYKVKHGIKENEKVLWNGISYGEGGAHYAVKGMYKDCHFFDVNSLYPSILVWLKMWKTPKANERYARCYYTRLFEKGAIKEMPKGYAPIELNGVDASYLKDSLKLVLNAPTGKFRQQFYTKAQDKAVGLAMCIIGQLIVTSAALHAVNGDCSKLIEVNTDSFAVNDPECIARAIAFEEPWPCIKFAHEVDGDKNEHGYQSFFRDVNNYCDFFEDGTIKAKGEEASELVKKKSQPVVIRSLWETLKNDKVTLLESDVFEDYVFKFSKSAGVRNFTIGGKPCDKKHVYMLFTDDSVGEDVTFSAERVNLQGVVKARHGVVAFDVEDLRPYFSHVDRSQYLEELKLLLVNWKPDLVSSFKEMFRSKRQRSKREFIESLPTLKYLRYKTCKDAIEAEKYLLSLGWNFQP